MGGFGKIGEGMGFGSKFGMSQNNSNSGGNNMFGGIGPVGGRSSSGLSSPGGNFGNSFNNGNNFFNNGAGMNDRRGSNMDIGAGNNRGGMMNGGRMENVGPQRDIMRSNSDLMGPRDMGMMGERNMMNRDMMSGDRNMMGSREMMGSRGDMRDMMGSRNEMMGSRNDMMGSRGDMMTSRNDMMGSRGDMRDMMGSRNDMMGSRNDMMGSRNDMRDMMGSRGDMRDMMERDNFMVGGPRDMMQQRSMSMSNGYGMNQGEHNSFSRSMSYSSNMGGGSSSPPNDGMKIGTWNEGRDNGSNGGGNFPSVSHFEIGTFNVNDPGSRSFGNQGGMNGATQSNNGPIQPGMGIRETGIIEKLLHSYGFIQCCDRQARLFFHFSQFDGNIEHLKIGDPVEFEMTYDRRTGKPIASSVSKIAPEVVMSEERVIGTVTTETKIGPEGSETQGRISYENRGECFFLPFTSPDVEGNVTLSSGDKVSFQVATVQRSGNLAAKTIRLENPAAPVKYQGVVNSLKDSFGFIERADVVKEIFFHISEVIDGKEEDNSHIQLGDDVEFIIQTRNGKEVACNLVKLPMGTVIFEDVGAEYFTGQVLKPLDRTGKYQQTDPLPGRVKYRAPDRSEVESSFGEKDQVGDFTLRHGDWIKFVIATDRRDKLKRATKIELLDESFKVSDEKREQGVIQACKEGFGFLKCVERSEKMFFHFSECLEVNRKLNVGDEMEFTVAPDPSTLGRQLATRIKHLPPATVKFDIVIAQNILGIITEEPAPVSWPKSPSKSPESPGKTEGAGTIVYELNGLQLSIPLYAADSDLRNTPKVGDKVQFNINQLKATKETNAVNIRILERANPVTPDKIVEPSTTPPKEKKDAAARMGTPQKGYVAALKDGFGFIETLIHDKEIFFHFSNVEGKAEKLEVGQEVEYSIYSREKGGKVSAEGVKPLTKGSIPKTPCKEEVLNGKVVRPLRSVNPDQSDYCGLIAAKSEEGTILGKYEFGIASLLNKKELLQEGDPVSFQVSTAENFALNVKSNKQKLRSHVEAVKGQSSSSSSNIKFKLYDFVQVSLDSCLMSKRKERNCSSTCPRWRVERFFRLYF